MKDTGRLRFVPILTEVVQTPGLQSSGPEQVTEAESPMVPALAPHAPEPAPTAEDELARRVLERVLRELEPIVLEALRTVQVQQARSLEVMVRAELATRVARLVDESLGARPRD